MHCCKIYVALREFYTSIHKQVWTSCLVGRHLKDLCSWWILENMLTGIIFFSDLLYSKHNQVPNAYKAHIFSEQIDTNKTTIRKFIHEHLLMAGRNKHLLFTLKNKSGKSKARKNKLKHIMLHTTVMSKYAEPWHASATPECLVSFSV